MESWRSRSQEDRLVGIFAGICFAVVIFVLVLIAAGIARDPAPVPPRMDLLPPASLSVARVQTFNNYQGFTLTSEDQKVIADATEVLKSR